MKARDVCERWKWRDPQQIIERLIRESSSTIGLPVTAPTQRSRRDHYYTQARRLHVKQLMRTLR